MCSVGVITEVPADTLSNAPFNAVHPPVGQVNASKRTLYSMQAEACRCWRSACGSRGGRMPCRRAVDKGLVEPGRGGRIWPPGPCAPAADGRIGHNSPIGRRSAGSGRTGAMERWPCWLSGRLRRGVSGGRPDGGDLQAGTL